MDADTTKQAGRPGELEVKAHENKAISGKKAESKYVVNQYEDLGEITNESDNVEEKVLDVSTIPNIQTHSVDDVAAHGLKISDFFSCAGTSIKDELGVQDMVEGKAVDTSQLDAKAPFALVEETVEEKAVMTSQLSAIAPISLTEKMISEKTVNTPQVGAKAPLSLLEEMLKVPLLDKNALNTSQEVNHSNNDLHKTYLHNMKYTDHFRCQHCKYRSGNKLNFISHYQVIHGVTVEDKESSGGEMRHDPSHVKKKKNLTHLCKLCNFGAKTRIGVSNHIRVKHRQEVKTVKYTTEFVEEVKMSSQEQENGPLKEEVVESDSMDDKFEFTFVDIRLPQGINLPKTY